MRAISWMPLGRHELLAPRRIGTVGCFLRTRRIGSERLPQQAMRNAGCSHERCRSAAMLPRRVGCLMSRLVARFPRPSSYFWYSGLLAPINTTVITALFVCALSVSGAIFLIVEMDTPFEGLIQISSEPMCDALAHLR